MREMPGFLKKHIVWVEPFLGTNSVGEVYGMKVPVRCMFADKIKMVRNANGEEVSSTSFYICTPKHRPPEGSRVTTPNGDVRSVVGLDSSTWPGMPIPANSQVYLS